MAKNQKVNNKTKLSNKNTYLTELLLNRRFLNFKENKGSSAFNKKLLKNTKSRSNQGFNKTEIASSVG